MIITLARTALHLSLGLFIGLFPLASMGKNTEKVPPVHEYQFDNGLKVLVKQDKRAPIAALYLWYKVGSSYEQEGTTGISHVLEHMMFKGTEKHATGRI